MIRFSAEVDGIETLNRSFNRVEQYISDFRSIWPAVAQEFYAVEKLQFDSQGAHGSSGKWAPLSPVYAKYKAIAFPGAPILQRERSLYESLTSPDAPDSIFRMTEDELTIGTQREGAQAHQRGSGRMPARPPIALTEDDKRRMQKAIQAQLVRFVRQAGFEVLENAA